MIPDPAYIYGLATMMYITAVVVLATVRWFHMCRPYDRNPKYYYPGRPFMTFSLLCSVTLLPYVADPTGTDSWFLVKTYFLPVQIFLMALMLTGYFAGVMRRRSWGRSLFAAGIPAAFLLLTAFTLAVWPGEQLADRHLAGIADMVVGFLGAISTVVCILSIRRVKEWAERFDQDDYSNPMDFPVRFARGLIILILTCVVLLWTAAILDSRAVMGGIQLFLMAVTIALLIASLHPNRHREIEETDGTGGAVAAEQKEESPSGGNPIPAKTAEQVLSAVRKVVETDKAFLESHLTLNDVAARSGYNRTYVAMVIKTEYGGFFKYINTLRLDYAETYKRTHPNASVSEVVSEAGFGSRQTYYNVKASLRPEA